MRRLSWLTAVAVLLGQYFGMPNAEAQIINCGSGHSGPQNPPHPGQNRSDSTNNPLEQDTVACAGEDAASGSSTTKAGSSDGSVSFVTTNSSGSTKRYVPYNRLATGPDGQPCATTGWVEEGIAPRDERSLLDPNPLESKGPNYRDVLEDYAPCPEQVRAPGQAAPVETRAMVAARAWDQRVRLPRPQPSIAPGRAITGKAAYLETNGQLSFTYTEDTVFGPLLIQARGSYTVSWGDGETTGPHSVEGKPWPSGQITHDYIHVGSYDILVTERWTANWSLDGESGTLRTLQTSGRIDGFPVEQIQAVIRR